MQFVSKCGSQILPDDALPLPLARPKVFLVAFQILYQFHAYVLLQEGLRLLTFFRQELGGFLINEQLLLTHNLTCSMVISVCLTLYLGRSASGSFT